MGDFNWVQEAFREEESVQKKCCTKEKLGYEPTWPIGVHPYVRNNEVALQFWGWEIVLLPDGHYFINDTSGG